MTEYIGITIGPILSTMELYTSPAALWASSYLFSYISKTIREVLMGDYGIPDYDIIAPFVPAGTTLDDGVGRFHDRIIFVRNDFDLEKISELKTKVIEIVAPKFNINKDFLKEYVSMTAVSYQADNAILGGSRLLDCMELAIPFLPAEDSNPILELFTGGNQARNETIKKIAKGNLGIDLDKWQLLSNKPNDPNPAIRSIEDIAAACVNLKVPDMKRYKYYAVLRSDGDRMTQIISSLHSPEDIQEYSAACLHYCQSVSEKIKEFGGVTIYASGDDLLALLPCYFYDAKQMTDQTILDAIAAINQCFSESFSTYIDKLGKEKEKNPAIPIPSLSFGIFIAYYKHPLYEAVHRSAELLFQKAKERRNCCCIRLVKHSGQEETFIIPNDSLANVQALASEIFSQKDCDETLLSVLYHLQDFHQLFDSFADCYREACDPKRLEAETYRLFVNLFDKADPQNEKFLHETLPEFFRKLVAKEMTIIPQDDQALWNDTKAAKASHEPSECSALIYLLRFLKFYIEKEGER